MERKIGYKRSRMRVSMLDSHGLGEELVVSSCEHSYQKKVRNFLKGEK
jgi:hypothetical protein